LVKNQVVNYIHKSFSHVATIPDAVATWLKAMFFVVYIWAFLAVGLRGSSVRGLVLLWSNMFIPPLRAFLWKWVELKTRCQCCLGIRVFT